MDAESFVVCEGRGEAPRRFRQSLGDANVRIQEPRPPEEPANRRGVDAAALDPCDEVRQYPTLYGWRDDRPSLSLPIRSSRLAGVVRTSERDLLYMGHEPRAQCEPVSYVTGRSSGRDLGRGVQAGSSAGDPRTERACRRLVLGEEGGHHL